MSRFVPIGTAIAAAIAASGIASAQQVLLVADSSADKIMLFDPNNGALINNNFIPDDPTSLTYNFDTPKDVIQVNNEIWVSDQLSDAIFRFNFSGGYVGTVGGIAGGLDNLRGMAFDGTTVYVANGGTNNGAPGAAVVRISPSGTILSNFSTAPGGSTSPFDVYIAASGELLVPDSSSDDIDRYLPDGTFLGKYIDSTTNLPINFPQQVASGFGGSVLINTFSPASGVYEYNSSGSTQLSFRAVPLGGRGVAALGNGNIFYTEGGTTGGMKVFNVLAGTSSTILTSSGGQYANVGTIPEPTVLGAVAMGLTALRLRRRRD